MGAGGRPPKSQSTRQTQQTLYEAGVEGAKLIRDILRGFSMVKGKRVPMKRVSGAKMKAAELAISHSIGLPKAKIEVTTGTMSAQEIAEKAAEFDHLATVELPAKAKANANN